MRKLILFSTAFVIALGMVFIVGGTSVCAEKIELKLAHFMPTMHVQHRMAFDPFAQKVAELTDGKVTVRIYPGGTLGNPKTMVDSIKSGITDIGFVIPSYVRGRFQRSSVFDLPFLFGSAVQQTEVMYKLYEKHFAEDYKQFKVLWFTAAPMSQVFTVKHPITSMADFKGLKIRTGNAVETEGVKSLGGNPVGKTVDELNIMLQKGVVDGAFTAYSALNRYKLVGVVNHMTELNYSGALMVVLMNKKKWDSLPDFAKKAINQATPPAFGVSAARAFDYEDLENFKMAISKGIQYHTFSPEEKSKLIKGTMSMRNDWVNKMKKKMSAQQILDDVVDAAGNL
jgi:TRAP-type C4-dicarboxylate transport system substrate-binding protein